MSRSHLDHITVTSPSLEIGAAFVSQALGVDAQSGGKHPRMGTHNLLLRLGDALFLEVISPDPDAAAPERPRWFGLDHLHAGSPPLLSTWVARTADIRATAAASAEPLGNIEPMQRGNLEWLITIPADGSVPVDGVAPALITWQSDVHPASTLRDRGLALVGLEIFHPEPTRIGRLLSSIDLEGPVTVSALTRGTRPCLVAHIDTPRGMRQLSSPSSLRSP